MVKPFELMDMWCLDERVDRQAVFNVLSLHPGRTVDVSTLREDLLLRLERERSDDVIGMRAKQKQVGATGLG